MNTPRIDTSRFVNAPLLRSLMALGQQVERSGLESSLLELVKIRASQINGCAFCLDMHTKDARAAGETEQRLYAVSVWRETPFFSDRERAALEWTEVVTRISDGHVTDDVYERVRQQFSDEEIVALTFEVLVINSFNRLNVAFRPMPVGAYQPGMFKAAAASA